MTTLFSDSKETPKVTRVLFVGQTPETVDYSDPAALPPPGLNAEKIQAGIASSALVLCIAALMVLRPGES